MLLSPEKMDRMNKDTTIHFTAPKEMTDNNIFSSTTDSSSNKLGRFTLGVKKSFPFTINL